MRAYLILTILVYFIISGCTQNKLIKTDLPTSSQVKEEMPVDTQQHRKVVLGNENFVKNYLHLVQGKRVGLLTNPSGVNSRLQSTADIFANHPDINLTALFGPEHGIRGAIYAGDHIQDEVDPKTGVPIFSLYGKNRKPNSEMVKNIDVFVVDIQDIGVRAYTYVYTMAKVMEAAAESGKPVIVLDRPNPLGGKMIEGNLVEEGHFSFVGLYPIPYRHAMTIGELAQLFNKKYEINSDLTVIPLQGWTRNMLWDETNLHWIPPSPHVPHWQTVLYMSTTGTVGELRTLSEGVGYTSPFEMIGAPWINGTEFADALNDLELAGVIFRPLYYKPYYATFKGEVCQGVQIHITEPQQFQSYVAGFHIVQNLIKLYPENDLFAKEKRVRSFGKAVGCAWIAQDLKNKVPVSEIEKEWQNDLEAFKVIRQKYLLY